MVRTPQVEELPALGQLLNTDLMSRVARGDRLVVIDGDGGGPMAAAVVGDDDAVVWAATSDETVGPAVQILRAVGRVLPPGGSTLLGAAAPTAVVVYAAVPTADGKYLFPKHTF